MAIVPPALLPTNLAPLPRRLAYAQSLGLERHPRRPKRGVPPLARRAGDRVSIEDLRNGHDLAHLVGFRLRARNLAIGRQIAEVHARPEAIRAPRACRAAQADGLGTSRLARPAIAIPPLREPPPDHDCPRPRTQRTARSAA